MSEFDEYIKSILAYSELSDIEQDELFLEMYDHLNSLKEEYMEQGMNEKEAIYKAIQSFGESKVIGVEINKSVYEVPRPLKVLSKNFMYSLYNHLFYCLFRNVYFNFYI